MAAIEEKTFDNTVLDISSLPKYEEVELIPLARKYLMKRNLGTFIGMILLLAGISIAYSFFSGIFRTYFPVVAGIYCFYLLWSFYANYQFYKRSGYAIRERDIIYKRGFVFEKTTIVPFNRIQHVSTNRGLLDKFLDLATVNIFTAGGSGSDVSIPGISHETAEKIKETLAERMSGHE